MDIYQCVYCNAKDQELGTACKGCGTQLTGDVENMKVKDLRALLKKNGFVLKMEYVQVEPMYRLAT